MTNQQNPQLIVALDVDSFDEARALVERLNDAVEIYKVGSQLFTTCGPEVIRYLLKADKKVFLDLKFHDIPNTVANAVASAVKINENGKGIFMCTLHTAGGAEMLKRAVSAATETAQNIGVKRPLLVGISVLTSEEKRDNILNLVLERSLLARDSGLDGVVASSQETARIREELDDDFIIVTPGIRPAGSGTDDQKRVATPGLAVTNGSNFLVVGRPVVQANDPSQAARSILNEIKTAQIS